MIIVGEARVCVRIRQDLYYHSPLVLMFVRSLAETFLLSPPNASVTRKCLIMTQIWNRLRILTAPRRNLHHSSRQTLLLVPNVSGDAGVLVQPGYKCNMKCVVYMRKELCTVSCCHVARPCAKLLFSARRRNRRRCPSSGCVSPSTFHRITAVLTMINRTWVACLAIVRRHWRLAHVCCFVDQLA